jgi:DNA-directed RNA polymerase subunit M
LKQVKGQHEVSITYVCDNCGYSNRAGKTVTQATEEDLATAAPIKIVGDKENKLNTLPTTKIECPKCGYDEASWWFLQTRSGDEPPTQFYRCLKCNHTWRSYS